MPQPTATSTPPTVLRSNASVNPYNSLIIDVDVTLDTPSKVYVEYANPRAGRFRTTTTESLDTHREISLLRLRPLTTYSYDVFVVDDQGRASKEWTGSFRAGPLPPGLNNAVAIVQGQPTYPLTLKEHNDDNFQGMVVLDSKGYIVWYFESTQGPPTANRPEAKREPALHLEPAGTKRDHPARGGGWPARRKMH